MTVFEYPVDFVCLQGESRLFPFGWKTVPSDKRHFVRLIKVTS
ncbi:hypothetical protein HMPREF0602_1986 [Neisseria meningitidis ATCC 13091]|uniref:Uncharacterized protein n=1 Tax=Neisseria meningitidis serogroup B (strain ATCC 13091 / M2091) TaxID=862513 RepID=E0NBV4_NEIM3|nr:hypothetical protein HMPREF0602_1986 [Neisseria meningitidis ATCC 13091]